MMEKIFLWDKTIMIFFPKMPYDFYKSTKIISSIYPQVFNYVSEDKFRRIIRSADDLFLVEAQYVNDVVSPRFQTKVLNKDSVITPKIQDEMKWLLACDFDLTPLYTLLENDPVLKHVRNSLFGMKILNSINFYEGLFEAVLEQQISKKASMSFRKRMAESICDYIDYEGFRYFEFPRAETVKELNESELCSLGLSKNKSNALIEIAKLEVNGDLINISKKAVNEIFETLLKIKGVGNWTIQYSILRGIGKYNFLMKKDKALINGYKRIFNDNRFLTNDDFFEFLNEFDDYQAYISFYIIYYNSLDFQRNMLF